MLGKPSNFIPPLLTNTVSIANYDGQYILEFGFCPNYDGTDYEGMAEPHTRILVTKELIEFLSKLELETIKNA